MPNIDKHKAADLRLRREYGITLADYNRMLVAQNGVCAICGRPPKRIRLAVDHNHNFEHSKVEVQRVIKQKRIWWIATALKGDNDIVSTSINKSDAVAAVRKELKRRSVRALLCMICNRKILGVIERFKVLPENVVAYLDKYDPERKLNQVQGVNV